MALRPPVMAESPRSPNPHSDPKKRSSAPAHHLMTHIEAAHNMSTVRPSRALIIYFEPFFLVTGDKTPLNVPLCPLSCTNIRSFARPTPCPFPHPPPPVGPCRFQTR